ncbi:MAG: hypothetical protein IJX80_09200 [Clostridia bacterium]|nr:hypothetical protein [Clostridia bacterium]
MLKFGWSTRSIAVEGPVGIIGQPHLRISHGIYDENFVTALVIDDGNEVSILLSGDLIFVDDGIIYDVRDAVKKRTPAIPAEKILFSATHTHTSPRYERRTDYDVAPFDRIEMTNPEICRRYLVEQTAKAIAEAYERRRAGAYSYGYGYAVVGHHRRPTYFDDLQSRPEEQATAAFAINRHAKMYGKTNDAGFAGYEGCVDSTVNVLFTFDEEGHLTGMIVNVPCPSQCSEQQSLLTADYWTDVRRLVREKYGDVYILPQCAAAGDLAPRPLHNFRAESRKNALKYGDAYAADIGSKVQREEIARRILAALDECYAWASQDRIWDAKLSHIVKNVRLEAWKITEEQYLAAKEEYAGYRAQGFVRTDDKVADFKENTKRGWLIGRCRSIIERYESGMEFRDAEIHLIRLGDVAFASNPFELYLAYQHRMQARSPFVQTFTVQLAAEIDVGGYLCTRTAAENMGYSAVAQSCMVSPAGGDTLVEETLKGLEELYEAKEVSAI